MYEVIVIFISILESIVILLYFNVILTTLMKWQPRWITAHVVSMYFRIVHHDRKKLRESLKGTPYLKRSDSRCSGTPGKYYYLYDLEYLLDILKVRPIAPIPAYLIRCD